MPTPKKWEWPGESQTNVAFHENVIFLYGIPKIGKTTLASKFPDALFLLTEEGAKHVPVKAYHIKKWTDYTEIAHEIHLAIQHNKFPFKTIVIDTVDNLSDFCEQFICDKHALNTLGDMEWGKGYKLMQNEFIQNVRPITQWGLGLIFISHADEKEVLINSVTNPYAPLKGDLTTGKVRMVVPTLERRAYKFISGLADMILYASVNTDNIRIINTQPTAHFEAGDRSGRLSPTVELNYTKILNDYYGEDNNLIERLNTAEQYLAQKKIDGFDVPTRVKNSRKKHLETEKLEDANIDKLENYLQHLRIKAKNQKKEKVNGDVSTD